MISTCVQIASLWIWELTALACMHACMHALYNTCSCPGGMFWRWMFYMCDLLSDRQHEWGMHQADGIDLPHLLQRTWMRWRYVTLCVQADGERVYNTWWRETQKEREREGESEKVRQSQKESERVRESQRESENYRTMQEQLVHAIGPAAAKRQSIKSYCLLFIVYCLL